MVEKEPDMKRFIFAVIATLPLIGISAPTMAQTPIPCGKGADLRSTLKKEYQEIPVSLGLGNNGGMVEVFLSTNRTFTILMTLPNGTSCMLATGEYWETLKASHKDKGPAT
jgi:hypothetical protein